MLDARITVGVGAAFNRTLFRQMGDVMGDEARAYYNTLNAHGLETNLVFWAPVSVNSRLDPIMAAVRFITCLRDTTVEY